MEWGLLPDTTVSMTHSATRTQGRIPWGIDAVKAERRPKRVDGIPLIKVCILDTGIDFKHDDFGGIAITAKDFTSSPNGVMDANGHGTHVAGTIAASVDNVVGVDGVSGVVDLYCAKVLGNDGSGTDRSIRMGIEWGIENGCRVFNCSLGGNSPMTWFPALLDQIVNSGGYFVAASGNGGNVMGAIYPARYEKVVSVGSFRQGGSLSRFSQGDRSLNFAAPGEQIESCWPGGGYRIISGTSMACPHVAGVIANALYAKDCGLRPVDVMDSDALGVLNQYAQKFQGMDKMFFGEGRLIHPVYEKKADPAPKPSPKDEFLDLLNAAISDIRIAQKNLATLGEKILKMD